MFEVRPSDAPRESHVGAATRTLWAVSDLHVRAPGNLDMVDRYVRTDNPRDWLIVAGDVAEDIDTVIRVLSKLATRYERVIYTPGNHELYARIGDELKGKAKYEALIRACQKIGVSTPEDPYLTFADHTIVPMFTLYDHSWRDPECSAQEAVAAAEASGIVLTDHYAIEPFEDVASWCRQRLKYTVRRLAEVSGPTVLVNHWPLVWEAMDNVEYKQIGLWSGSRHTQTWAGRYHATCVIYGHLHIPLNFSHEGVTHAEVSLGYPRDWQKTLKPRLERRLWPYKVLTEEVI